MNAPPTNPSLPTLLKACEVARVLGLAERTLRDMNRRRELTYIRYGGEVRYELSAVLEFIGRKTRLASGQAPALLLPEDWGRVERLIEAAVQMRISDFGFRNGEQTKKAA